MQGRERLRLVAFAVLMMCLVACREELPREADPIRSVKTMTITEATKANQRRLSGVVKSELESQLSFRVSGRVDSVRVNQGDRVKSGQILATLESNDYQLQVKSAKAELESAKAELTNAHEDFKRHRELAKNNYSSQSELDRAEATYHAAISKVDIAKSRLENTLNDLQRTVMTAPFEGSVGVRKVEPHEEVKAGQMLFTLQSKGHYEIEILVPETIIDEVELNDKVVAHFPTIARLSLAGHITEISSKSESGNAFPITVKLDETSPSLRVGLTAEVDFYYGEESHVPIYLIPTTAIDLRFFDPKLGKLSGQVPLYVYDPKDKAIHMRRVNVRDVRGNLLEVDQGLRTGDIVVVAGVSFLNDGQQVKLWQPSYNLPATLDL